MTVHDELMTEWGAPALMEHHGTPERILIKPVGLNEFRVDAIAGPIRGVEQFTDADQTVKVLSAQVHILRSAFAAMNITNLPMMAQVDGYGMDNWTINLGASVWGEVWVQLGLERETLAREYQARRNATV